jgi:trimethylamine:corrinoid methyltransferase-like protein
MRNSHPAKHRRRGFGLTSLTDDELDDIHLAALEVLEKTGLFIGSAGALDVFEGAGAEVDRVQNIVKIPPYLVEEAMRSAPSTILLAGRNPNHDKMLVKIAGAIVGGIKKLKERPILSFTTCPVSPLTLINECCEIIMEAARTGSVINILSMALAGGTSPVTLAGTLVIHNAEVLGGITLNQLVNKGAPVIYGSSTTAMDLKIGSVSVGTPECAVISGAVARLARYYALPSYVAGG